MPDTIVVASNYGDVILLSGKCWSLVGTTTADVTHGSPVSAYSTCSGCIAGNSPLDPPSGISLSMGDMHYIYGKPSTALTPTLASFNVDDNSGGTELVWWTHTEGSTEYVIKYTQQAFDFTSGGWSIDQVVVSASDGSVADTYTFTDPQSASRRNGGAWLNSGVSALGDSMTYNITERIIPNAECPAVMGVSSHFGLFNLEVSPSSGFYSAPDEFGGALWYVWKQLGTAYGAGAVNNPSSANFDGLGTFLSGINGYSARSQFEVGTNYSSVREVFDLQSASAVITKLDELAGIDGLWNADWDPLVDDPIDCGLTACGTPNGNPTMFITMSWSDADVTKSWLGCTWTNGEQKEVYTTSYTAPNMHDWQRNPTGANGNFSLQNRTVFPSVPAVAYLQIGANMSPTESAYFYVTRATNGDTMAAFGGTNTNSNFGTPINSASWMQLTGAGMINSSFNGSASTTGGITIAWELGNGW